MVSNNSVWDGASEPRWSIANSDNMLADIYALNRDFIGLWELQLPDNKKAFLTVYENSTGFAGCLDFYTTDDTGRTVDRLAGTDNPRDYPKCWELLPVEWWHPIVQAGWKRRGGRARQNQLFREVREAVVEHVQNSIWCGTEGFEDTQQIIAAYGERMRAFAETETAGIKGEKHE